MGKIKILDTYTANKIAAGEVVERPASVVKELIENSIDAGSSRISVLVTRGGLESIAVIDNGEGMDYDDAVLAFERHATSKIVRDEDLEAITTLGFRGEALPSIAAVAKVELKTRPHAEVGGIHIVIKDGRIVQKNEIGSPPGTSICVSQLFANIPARLKSVKSVSLEAGHISDVISRMAVAYPKISFSLEHEGRTLLKTTGNGELLSIIATLYGTDMARNLIPVSEVANGLAIEGYISKPSLSRASRNHQIFIVNGRVVRNRFLSQAVERGYHSLLMTGRHPVFFLNINLEHSLIDPNVHPAKTEVRFFTIDQLIEDLGRSVADALKGNVLIPKVNRPLSKENRPIDEADRFDQVIFDMSKSKATGQVSDIITITDRTTTIENNDSIDVTIVNRDTTINRDTIIRTEKLKDVETGKITEQSMGSSIEEIRETPKELDVSNITSNMPELRPLGQIDLTYIVAQGDEGLYLIDQHAAHERVLYETAMAAKEDDFSQMLALPQNIEITFMETQVLINSILEFQKLGFVVEYFGGESFIIRGVPKGFPPGTEKQIFMDLLDYFCQNRNKITGKQIREKMLIMMACKAAIKAGDKLSQGQMENLLDSLGKTAKPYTCPHGRPTIIHFSRYELEKLFKRVV